MGRRQGLALALTLGLLVAFGVTPIVVAQGQSVTVDLASQNNSGVTGSATITDLGGGRLRIQIRANGAAAGPEPAHIHEGTCAQLNPAPDVALTDVVNGASMTEVSGSLQALLASPHAIHMHKSPVELPIYVACADIRMAAGQPATLPSAGEATSGATLAAGVAATGIALIAAGYALCRRRAS